ncbi:hypothetical protein GCM10011581_13930 [Saccharopolyspora subtropica]|uniref:Uncharacterized protein n=1 Tax=Saccharopolyspora thermophila TaxID=89367 RepID=A0A917JQ24_9PSEU|nr:hypothetical protein GCM10011581_13930 [Saccharopolyspora subtropica]
MLVTGGAPVVGGGAGSAAGRTTGTESGWSNTAPRMTSRTPSQDSVTAAVVAANHTPA